MKKMGAVRIIMFIILVCFFLSSSMLSDGTFASMMGGGMMDPSMMGGMMGNMGGGMMGGDLNQQLQQPQQLQQTQHHSHTNPSARNAQLTNNNNNNVSTTQNTVKTVPQRQTQQLQIQQQQQPQQQIADSSQQQIDPMTGLPQQQQQQQIDPITGMPQQQQQQQLDSTQQQQDIDPITGLPKQQQNEALKEELSNALTNPGLPTNSGAPLTVPAHLQSQNKTSKGPSVSPKYAALLKKIGESFLLQMKIRQQRKEIGDPTNPTPLVAIVEYLEEFKSLLASVIVREKAGQKVLVAGHSLIRESYSRILSLFKEVYGIELAELSPILTSSFEQEQKLLGGEVPKEKEAGPITLSADLDNLTKIEQQHLSLCTDYMKSLPSTSLYEGRNRRNELTSAIEKLAEIVGTYAGQDNNQMSDMLSLIRRVSAAQQLLSQGEDKLEDVAMTEARRDQERKDQDVRELAKSKNITPIQIQQTPPIPDIQQQQLQIDPQQQQQQQQPQQMDMNGININDGAISTGMGL